MGEPDPVTAQSKANGTEAAKRIKVLETALRAARRAIGDHTAPHDCYATGPLTGDPFLDLIECPACTFILHYDRVLTQEPSYE